MRSVAITQHRNRGLHCELLANTQSGQIKSEVLRCDDELYVRYLRTTYQLPETESPFNQVIANKIKLETAAC